MQDLIGHNFGGYELKELVGTGGMASIYKGFDEKLDRWVAIKVMAAQVSTGAEEIMLARFRLEAQAIAKLRHPNILTIYGYGEEQGWAYIIMEYVAGGSLQDRLKTKNYTWQQALEIVIPVAEALAWAHKHGIVHRDIKPANILMSYDDWPLLADFGLAKMEQPNTPGLTMPGQVLGTMAYAAPEQIEEGKIDARVDIYSLGVVLYELLTKKLPFLGETAFDFLMARLTDPPIPLLKVKPDLPPFLASIMDKALAQSPTNRYQSMDEFLQILVQARDTAPDAPYRGRKTTSPLTVEALQQTTVRLKLLINNQEIFTTANPEQATLLIGREYKTDKPEIDLAPYDGAKAGVSRQHSRLLRIRQEWFIEDLGSKNGTFVNSVRVAPHQMKKIVNGDVIRCSQIELMFEVE